MRVGWLGLLTQSAAQHVRSRWRATGVGSSCREGVGKHLSGYQVAPGSDDSHGEGEVCGTFRSSQVTSGASLRPSPFLI